jgi:hypothetical protein
MYALLGYFALRNDLRNDVALRTTRYKMNFPHQITQTELLVHLFTGNPLFQRTANYVSKGFSQVGKYFKQTQLVRRFVQQYVDVGRRQD